MIALREVKRQEQKKQKSENKKGKVSIANSRALLSNSTFRQEEIDKICPNISGMRSAKIINNKEEKYLLFAF